MAHYDGLPYPPAPEEGLAGRRRYSIPDGANVIDRSSLEPVKDPNHEKHTIPEHFDDLERAVARLADNVETLLQRIDTVLLPEPPSIEDGQVKGAAERDPKSYIANMLYGLENQVDGINTRVIKTLRLINL